MKKTLILAIIFLATSTLQLFGQTIVAWDFNNITPGDLSSVSPSSGEGLIRLIGGTNSPTSGSTGYPT